MSSFGWTLFKVNFALEQKRKSCFWCNLSWSSKERKKNSWRTFIQLLLSNLVSGIGFLKLLTENGICKSFVVLEIITLKRLLAHCYWYSLICAASILGGHPPSRPSPTSKLFSEPPPCPGWKRRSWWSSEPPEPENLSSQSSSLRSSAARSSAPTRCRCLNSQSPRVILKLSRQSMAQLSSHVLLCPGFPCWFD